MTFLGASTQLLQKEIHDLSLVLLTVTSVSGTSSSTILVCWRRRISFTILFACSTLFNRLLYETVIIVVPPTHGSLSFRIGWWRFSRNLPPLLLPIESLTALVALTMQPRHSILIGGALPALPSITTMRAFTWFRLRALEALITTTIINPVGVVVVFAVGAWPGISISL